MQVRRGGQEAKINGTTEEIEGARRVLAGLDPTLELVHRAIPPFAWRRRPLGFKGLMRFLLEQQISLAAAAAIWGRLEAGLGEVTPEQLLATDDVDLRSFGFSASKIRHARALALATLSRSVDFDHLQHRSDEDAVAALTALDGVGPWTAQVYLMMSEGRSDIFPGGDIALKEALRLLEGGDLRLTDQAITARAALWRPHRSVAAHMLWAFYLGIKSGEIAAPERSCVRMTAQNSSAVLEATQKSFKTDRRTKGF